MYGVTRRDQIATRLQVYDRIRHNRASSIQLLSSAGLDQGAHPDVEQYMEGNPVPGKTETLQGTPPFIHLSANEWLVTQVTPQDLKEYALLHDVVGRSAQDMRRLDSTYSPPSDFLHAETVEDKPGHSAGL